MKRKEMKRAGNLVVIHKSVTPKSPFVELLVSINNFILEKAHFLRLEDYCIIRWGGELSTGRGRGEGGALYTVMHSKLSRGWGGLSIAV